MNIKRGWIKSVMTVALSLPFLLVLSTVFVIDYQLAQGVITGKYFWFYASMVLASAAVLLSIIIYKQWVRLSLLDLLLTLFCGCGLWVTYYHTSEITTKGILLLLLLTLYFYFRIFFTQDRWKLPALLLFYVLTGLIEAVWGLCQLYGFSISQHSLFKTTGSFFNPGPYAGYLAVVFPLALYWVHDTRYKIKGKKILGIATCIAILLVLPATMSRAAWLAVIIGSLVVVIPCLTRDSMQFFRKWRIKSAMTVSIVILFCATLFGMYSLKKDSADGRVLMWKVAMHAIPKHPFGVGLGNFPGTYASEQAAYFASGQASELEELVAGSPEYGFNEYLQICLEWGIIPFILFLTIIVRCLYAAYKRKQYGILGSFVSVLVFAFMSYPFSVLPFPIILVFFSAAIVTPNSIDNQHFTKFPLRDLGFTMLGCLLTAFCFYNRYPTCEAYKKYNMAQMLYWEKAYGPAKKEYESLYPQLNDHSRFLFEYGHLLSNIGDYKKSNEILQQVSRFSSDPMIYNIIGKNYQALKEYEQAETSFIHATQMVPHRLYPWYLLCKLYAEMGLPNKVKEAATIVQTKEPKVQSMAVKEMREEVLMIVETYN
jgi:O-antigen ligase